MLSIITPTYNRAAALSDLRTCLMKQTCTLFEWLIVDDGSVDSTRELVEEWIRSNDSGFSIRYLWRENGGKHRAVNMGVLNAAGDYIWVVDSDDCPTPTAVEHIESWLELLPEEEGGRVVGVSGLKASRDGVVIGGVPSFSRRANYIEATNLQRRQRGLGGDKAEVYRRSVMVEHPFPEFSGETFIGEESAWNAIAAEGNVLRWYNSVLCVCEYRPDGLTANVVSLLDRNLNGAFLVVRQHLEYMPYVYGVSAISALYRVPSVRALAASDIASRLQTAVLNVYLGRLLFVLRAYVLKHWS